MPVPPLLFDGIFISYEPTPVFPDLSIPTENDPSVVGWNTLDAGSYNGAVTDLNWENIFGSDNSSTVANDGTLQGYGSQIFMDNTQFDPSGAVPLSAGDTTSGGGFWESLGKALGDSFNTVANTAAQTAGQALGNATVSAQNKIKYASAPPPNAANVTTPGGNFLATPAGMIAAVAAVAVVVYLIAKKS